ncbi:hypothetical protein PCANC_16219 [Puccinia coronata f. sp. avenae]|uniref:Uncharacterized protein n=1 Tax=Puccinia coronata f. sp. avenae TaxID=200324 RepID=A0A2N5S2U5_9BASI|nr:hypothetical protein PCASD_23458 [Puccinia coronata f. sp. avenae]PLW31581.1 hypothetical protein PCANC_16219 [Puccinia coronata f. sp. avenae]
MVFNDQSIRIRTRVRSAFGRLRPSKSSLGLASLIKPEWVPPVPLPVLDLPKAMESEFNESQVFEEFWDKQSTAPVLLKRSDKKLSKRPAPRQKKPVDPSQLPVLDQMLIQQGLLDSPISIHLTSLLAESSHSLLSSSDATRRRSSSESYCSPSLLCLQSAGPFTPELVINHVGKSTPELSATLLHVDEAQSYFPLVSCADASTSPLNATPGNIASSPNPSLRAVKLSASPSHRCLKRRGLIPSSQPISSQLLQSVVSTSPSNFGPQTETVKLSVIQLEPPLSAEIGIWPEESDKRSTLRPQQPTSRQPLAVLDRNLPLPLPTYGRKDNTQADKNLPLPSPSYGRKDKI